MSAFQPAASRPLRRFLGAALLSCLALLTGCATHYVDGSVKDTPSAQFVKPAQPKPAQLLFEFQTKGTANARATDHIKPMVSEAVRSTGLFSELQDTPAAGGGVLSVTLNNVPLSDDAFSKGFVAGLTFGAAGQQVTDGYICTVSYLPPGQSKPVVKTARHAIHTTVGAKDGPVNAYKASNIEDAVRTMVRQVMGVTLADLSRDGALR
ncbi:hypothetical protein GCM10027034_33120 [Ramlibacter solisilvae]|uniref:Lipoprotein n=1 Tax=Ramlibacter tataouinensis TaxID=94132 RepID=A0A127JS77_9BURK|nr:hypothetical protein [Ramlibacter tataouinensis]AMO22831.1 hypothetical protein UC35_07925 [Ramlibacter tataouinensis]